MGEWVLQPTHAAERAGLEQHTATLLTHYAIALLRALSTYADDALHEVFGWRFQVAVGRSLEPVLDTVDERHGRLTRRRVFVHPVPTELEVLENWPGSKSILAVESIRMINPHGAVTAEKRFVLSNVLAVDARQIAAIRQHWSIENSLHWVLDVTFQEDATRIREPHGRRNRALLRKIAINLIHHRTTTGRVRGRRKQTAWDNNFMAQLLS